MPWALAKIFLFGNIKIDRQLIYKNGDYMKKLLLILVTGLALTCQVQAMEKLKALFSVDTCYINGQKINNYDACSLCNNKHHPPLAYDHKQRVIGDCKDKCSFHKECIQPWGQRPFTCPCCWTSINKLSFMDDVGGIKAVKMATLGISYMLAKAPFAAAEIIFGQKRLEKCNLGMENSLGSLLHSYLTLLVMKTIDSTLLGNRPYAADQSLYPITKTNIKNVLMLSISKSLLNQLDENSKLERSASSVGQIAQVWILPQILDHKKI